MQHQGAHFNWIVYWVQVRQRLHNKLFLFLLTCFFVYDCSDVGQPLNAKLSPGSIKRLAQRVLFFSSGLIVAARAASWAVRDLSKAMLPLIIWKVGEQIAMKVLWQSVNRDSGLLIVPFVSKRMPDRLGQVMLVDVATLHHLITAHAVADTGNAATSNLEHLDCV